MMLSVVVSYCQFVNEWGFPIEFKCGDTTVVGSVEYVENLC